MHDPHGFLLAVTVVLCVAALTTVLFHRLRLPVVLGYVLAGLIVGPHVPVPLIADPAVIRTLSELGVILLMFSVGLEFRVGKLAQLGSTGGLTAVIETSFMMWVGFVVGRSFGWTVPESLFTGAIVAISSTTIVAKAFADQRVAGKLKERVIGILVVEDLIAILLMAALTALATGRGLSATELAATLGRLAAFLIGLVVVGLLVVPRFIRYVVRLRRPETTVVASVGVCFGIALLAQWFGYSVALGAFVAGSLVAESGKPREIEHRIEAVRDVFAAIFFVSVGMSIDPSLILREWAPVAALVAVVIGGKIVSVTLGAFLTGTNPRLALQSGMSLAQIGEFSFIIAGLGLALGATRDFLYPVAVAVSAVTTLTTPFLIRASGSVASRLDQALPKPLQTFVTLYGTWLDEIREQRTKDAVTYTARRVARLLLIDAAFLAGIVIGASIARPKIVPWLARRPAIDERIATVLVVAAAVALSIPFGIGIVRLARRLGSLLADTALPRIEGRADLAAAPRRALRVTLQLAILLLVGTPLVALTQPFLPGVPGALLLAVGLVVLAVPFWRSAANLEGHVRAGAEVIAEALSKSSRAIQPDFDRTLDPVHGLLPGLGEPVPFRLEGSHAAVGKTLSALGLRGLTGATVLAISRDGQGIVVPSPEEALRAGDVLALAGTEEAVASAKALLAAGLARKG